MGDADDRYPVTDEERRRYGVSKRERYRWSGRLTDQQVADRGYPKRWPYPVAAVLVAVQVGLVLVLPFLPPELSGRRSVVMFFVPLIAAAVLVLLTVRGNRKAKREGRTRSTDS